MIAVGLLAIVLAFAVGLLFIFLTRLWTLEVVFTRVSWIPLVTLVFEGMFFQPLMSALSYFAIAIPLLTCFASLCLTCIGATLLASARQRHEQHRGLLRATFVASVPGVLLAGYVLYAFLAYSLRRGV